MQSVSPKVSVLVPIFNVEKYLEQCLESIIKQTLKDIEIICINDGSTDGSLRIIKRYAKRDNRIVIINKKNSGYGDSMNQGLKKATGKYIGIVESDDWIELDAFEKLYRYAAKHDVDVVKGNYFNYYTDPNKRHISGTVVDLVHPGETGRVVDPSDTYHIFFQRPAIWTAIYRRAFLEEQDIQFLPSQGASYQDTGFNFKVWVSTHKAFFTKEAFLHYRQDNETSSVNSPGKVYSVSDEYAEIEEFMIKNNLLDTYGDRMRIAKWGAYYWNIDRLTAALAEDFIALATKEYRKDFESGRFNFELCDVNQVRDIGELIHHPERTVKRKYAAENAKVSVIVPVFNAEWYLRKSVDSLLKQTLKDIEVIFIDDGSTDGSSDILEKYFQADPRIRLVNQYNQGQSVARNRGIELAHAQYVAFLDSDDYFEIDALHNLHDLIESEQSDLAMGSIRVVYDGVPFTAMDKNADMLYYTVKLRGTQQVTDTLIDKVDTSPCNKIFKKSILAQYGIRFPDGLRYEDAYFFYAYMWSIQKVSFLSPDVFVYNYVRRPGSTMTQTFGGVSFAYDHIEIVIRLFKFLKENRLFKKHAAYFAYTFEFYFNLSYKHLPEDQRERLYATVRQFIKENNDYFLKHGVNLSEKFDNLLPEEKTVEVEKRTVVIKAKSLAKQVLPKISPAYRAQIIIMDAVSVLHHKIDRLTDDVNQEDIETEMKIQQITQVIRDLNKRIQDRK